MISMGVREPIRTTRARAVRRGKSRGKIVRIDYRSGEDRTVNVKREVWKMLQTELGVIETIVSQLRRIGDAMEP